jgi:hypothetical protein
MNERRMNLAVIVVLVPVGLALILGVSWLVLSLLLGIGAD